MGLKAAFRCLIVVWVALLVSGCGAAEETDTFPYLYDETPLPARLRVQAEVEGPPPPALPLPLYSPDSPWNQPIPPDAAVDPRSDEMIALLVEDARNGSSPPVLSVREWSVTVYVADENTPRTDVRLTAPWSSAYGALLDVPIPEGALPDPAGDSQIAILDLSTGYEYDFWQIRRGRAGEWAASWGNRIALESDGIYPTGMSARGSGFALLAGLIWPEEFAQGRIEHALLISLPHTATGGPVWPATESDGWSDDERAIPEGARLQLDPTLNLDEFEMRPYERIIAEALQRYGAFVGDSSGSIELEAVNPISYPEDPYPEGWFDVRWALLPGIPWEHMRVLELPPQNPDPLLEVADETIYR